MFPPGVETPMVMEKPNRCNFFVLCSYQSLDLDYCLTAHAEVMYIDLVTLH